MATVLAHSQPASSASSTSHPVPSHDPPPALGAETPLYKEQRARNAAVADYLVQHWTSAQALAN